MLLLAGWVPMEEKTLQAIFREVFAIFRCHSCADELKLLGLFAGTIGVRRLLKLFAKYDIKTTWFIPGHSLETFPEECRMVRDAGHEMYDKQSLRMSMDF